jgi:regulator of protease activity HflC (stomatin/prohibitin superfamily)
MIPLSWPWCIAVLRDYERAVHFRLGKSNGAAKGPGIFFFLPFVDEYKKVDLRIKAIDVPIQEMITKDSVTIKVNAVVFIRVVDPNKTIIQCENYMHATTAFAQTTLSGVIGSNELDDLLSKRDRINSQLREIVDIETDQWGVKVIATEVKDVLLPQKMQRAMASQAETERSRRAKVISAEGEVQASKRLALAAQTMQAEPLSIQLRYLQTLSRVSAEKNSTIIFPVPVDMMANFTKKTK